MDPMAEKKIYYICGYLRSEERENDFLKYGMKLGNSFKDQARNNPALGSYKMVNVYSCTKQEFLKIWTDPSTYGIFWNSHADQNGIPQADTNAYEKNSPVDLNPRPHTYILRGDSRAQLREEVDQFADKVAIEQHRPYLINGYDDSRVTAVEGGRFEIEVTAAELPAASPNLKFAAFFSCGTPAKQGKDWKEIMPPGAFLPVNFGETEDTTSKEKIGPSFEDTRGYVDKWIDDVKMPQFLFGKLTAGGTQPSGSAGGRLSDRLYTNRRRIGFWTPAPEESSTEGGTLPGLRDVLQKAPPADNQLEQMYGVYVVRKAQGKMTLGSPLTGGAVAPHTIPQHKPSPLIKDGVIHKPQPIETGIPGTIPRGKPILHPTPNTMMERGSEGKRPAIPGGYRIGDPTIVQDIHSRYRPIPKRQPLTPPSLGGMSVEIRIKQPDGTWSNSGPRKLY
jgi:hypothetical protein